MYDVTPPKLIIINTGLRPGTFHYAYTLIIGDQFSVRFERDNFTSSPHHASEYQMTKNDNEWRLSLVIIRARLKVRYRTHPMKHLYS